MLMSESLSSSILNQADASQGQKEQFQLKLYPNYLSISVEIVTVSSRQFYYHSMVHYEMAPDSELHQAHAGLKVPSPMCVQDGKGCQQRT